MIKVFVLFFVTHGAMCAPGPPFVKYGVPEVNTDQVFLSAPDLPGVKNLEEKALPELPYSPESLPGTRNLEEKSQLPENLPGTNNLREKTLLVFTVPNFYPEQISRIPNSFGELNLPEFSKPETPRSKTPGLYTPETPAVLYAPETTALLQPAPAVQGSPPAVQSPLLTVQGPPPAVQRPLLTVQAPPPAVQRPLLTVQAPPLAVQRPPLTVQGPPPAVQGPYHDVQGPGVSHKYGIPQYTSGEEILSDAIPGPDAGVDGEKDAGPIVLSPGTRLKLQDDRGQYSHGFSSPDGTEVQESGRLITTNGGWEYVIAKTGSYKYVSPEGIPITARYIADENGFRILSRSFGSRALPYLPASRDCGKSNGVFLSR